MQIFLAHEIESSQKFVHLRYLLPLLCNVRSVPLAPLYLKLKQD